MPTQRGGDAAGDVWIRPARGLPHGVTIPAAELTERFSRSSGPGGQSVNTADSRVELRWDVRASAALDDVQRARLMERLDARLVDGVLAVTASEHRSQLRNRLAARARLAALVSRALVPPAHRRPTRRSAAAKQRRLDAKRRRSQLKAARQRPPSGGE